MQNRYSDPEQERHERQRRAERHADRDEWRGRGRYGDDRPGSYPNEEQHGDWRGEDRFPSSRRKYGRRDVEQYPEEGGQAGYGRRPGGYDRPDFSERRFAEEFERSFDRHREYPEDAEDLGRRSMRGYPGGAGADYDWDGGAYGGRPEYGIRDRSSEPGGRTGQYGQYAEGDWHAGGRQGQEESWRGARRGGRGDGRAGGPMYRDRGAHRGKGPKGYSRSDDRIAEDVNERLMMDSDVEASDIEVSVSGGEVTLTGAVDSKFAKRCAEDCADDVSGVQNVQNNLRVRSGSESYQSGSRQAGGNGRKANNE